MKVVPNANGQTSLNTNMAIQINKIPEIRLSALRMHSASSVQIPNHITNFTSLQLMYK